MGQRGRRIRYWLIGATVVIIVLFGARRWRDGASTAPPPHTVTVRRGTLVDAVVATGKIEPKTKVDLKSKVNGIVTRLLVDEGDAVRDGQVVAELDKEVAEARVKEARANVLAAQGRASQAQVEVSSTERDYAQQELRRRDSLRRKGVVSEEEFDKAKRDFDVAEIRFNSAKANLRIAEAQVAQAEAILERAENELRDVTIVAPMTGTVLSRDVDVGAGVSAVGSSAGFGTTLMVIGDVSELHVVGQVDEVDIGRVALGQSARIRVESFPNKLFDGEVTKIAPQGKTEEKVVNFEVEVKLRADKGGLRPMMTADAEIIIAERPNTLIIPEAAVVRDGTAAFVERPIGAGAETERIPVSLGVGNGSEIEVLDGLSENQAIVGP